MHPIKPMLARSAAPRDTHELSEGLRDDIFEVWAEVEALDPPTLATAYERFVADLTLVPHTWSKHHISLAEGTRLAPATMLRLALLCLDELGTSDRRSYAGRVEGQPWFRAYELLSEATNINRQLAELDRPLRWLVVDALLECCDADSRVNPMQQATGVLWTSWQIERNAGLDMEPTMARTWTLARRGFERDGYDDGSYEFSFADLAGDAGESVLAAQLALVHAFMRYATTPSSAHDRRLLRDALAEAETLELDIKGLRALCLPVIASFLDVELPVRAAAVPSD